MRRPKRSHRDIDAAPVSIRNLTNPDFAVWASAFGAKGFTIADESQIPATIAEAFATSEKPVVIHCHTPLEQISAWRRRNLPR